MSRTKDIIKPDQAGVIKNYIDDRGFGFIIPDGGGADVFFHIKDVKGNLCPMQGDKVTYDLVRNNKLEDNRPKAGNVTLLEVVNNASA